MRVIAVAVHIYLDTLMCWHFYELLLRYFIQRAHTSFCDFDLMFDIFRRKTWINKICIACIHTLDTYKMGESIDRRIFHKTKQTNERSNERTNESQCKGQKDRAKLMAKLNTLFSSLMMEKGSEGQLTNHINQYINSTYVHANSFYLFSPGKMI